MAQYLKRKRVTFLGGRPQRRGICSRLRIVKPKKPNSAQRKVARVEFPGGLGITAAIPGQGHTLQQFSVVLLRGGRVRDLPGVRHKIIRGALDATGVSQRGQRRSKFGTKNWKRRGK